MQASYCRVFTGLSNPAGEARPLLLANRECPHLPLSGFGALGAILLEAPLAAFLVGGLEAALFLGFVAHEGIHVAAEFHRDGRGEQVELVAEYIGEIPLVG